MKAIRVNEFGNPEVMLLEEAPDPEPGIGEELTKDLSSTFGENRKEDR